MIRKHDKQLQQIVRRYAECQNINRSKPSNLFNSQKFSFLQPHNTQLLVKGCTPPEFKMAVTKFFKLSVNINDSCCTLKDKSIIEIKNFAFAPDTDQHVVIGKKYKERYNFFEKPCLSSFINIYFVRDLD